MADDIATGLARLGDLRADGGMTKNELLMPFQAGIHGFPVAAPALAEITATGAEYAAGPATRVWSGLDELRANHAISRRWEPGMDDDTRTAGLAGWRRGVDRTLGLAAPEPAGAGAAS